MLKDSAEAEDATQEAFVKLWNHRDRIDREKIKPWLMKVTRNTCLDRLRRRRNEVEFEEYQSADDQGPLSGLQQSELGRWLKQAIGSLKEPYRTLVVLRDIYQHSYEEVANATELSLSQVKVYLHRARKELREQLAEIKP
jgi:RNA polymerase sigma-70 factor (ECF subfamily)